MAGDLDFYFDFSSPYGYFAAMRIDGDDAADLGLHGMIRLALRRDRGRFCRSR